MRTRLLRNLAAPVIILGVWQLLSHLGLIKPVILPSPVAVVERFGLYVLPVQSLAESAGVADWIWSSELLSDLVASLTSAPRPDLSRVRSDSQVTFIRVSVMPGYSKDKMQLSPAVHQAMVGTEAAVSLNAALLGRLIDRGYSTTDVIAVSVDPKGGVTVFVNK